MNDSSENALNPLETRAYFVRGKNALAVRANFGPLYEDYYLHWMQHGIRFSRDADDVLKDALAAVVLHLASRPQDETVAWTVNLPSPRVSLFVTGSTRPSYVVGRVWTGGIRMEENGLFCAETRREMGDQHRSNVEFGAGDFFQAVETYYRASEQRGARYFRLAPEEFVMVTAQPECDLDWLAGLNDVKVQSLEEDEELALLETRRYVFDCGCNAEHIVGRLAVLGSEDKFALFGDAEEIRVDCPRCGAYFNLTRRMFGL